jgi:hypothetical protein
LTLFQRIIMNKLILFRIFFVNLMIVKLNQITYLIISRRIFSISY